MIDFFSAALSFPTVVFTVALLAAGGYWSMVLLGALGVDILEFDVDGATDGAVEGAAEGAAEGVAEGVTEGVAEGVAEAAAEGAAEAAAEGATEAIGSGSHGLLGSLLSVVRIKGVPVTIVLSFALLYAWIIAHVGTLYVLMGTSTDSTLLRGALFVVASVSSIPLAALTARPLRGVVGEEVAVTRADLVGKIVRVGTSRVDARFGTATFDDGGGGLNLQIRCDADNGLCRGAQALILAWDKSREAFEVTPFDN